MDSITLKDIAGDNLQIYEKYFAQVNPSNADIIKALDAAAFIRKSGLNQITLKNIWDLSDPSCLGYLDKKSLFIALKLIALVQNGRSLNMSDITTPLPPPIIGDNVVRALDWQISPEDLQKHLATYRSLNPIDGKLAGSKVKPYMVASKLPLDLLTKIWDLSDIDQDGFLNMKEFVLCCHFINKTQQGYTIPPELPPELRDLRLDASRSGSLTASPLTIVSDNKWVISDEEKAVYDAEFVRLDKDLDGFVTGGDVKDTLLQSGLPQPVLADIWNLCDISRNGKLNKEQFALTNYFIKQKQSGLELPPKLLPNQVPPSFRPKQEPSVVEPSKAATPVSEMSKELQAMQDDIRNLEQTKKQQEQEIMNEEILLKKKQSEKLTIVNEIETLIQMLKQLENQKNDAAKKLKDLDAQIVQLDTGLHALTDRLCLEQQKVETLNQQMLEQKKKIDEEENDLKSKSKEFVALREEEVNLETSLSSAKSEVEAITKTAAETQLEISHIKADMLELDEYKRRVNEILDDFDMAICSFDYAKIASLLPRSVTPPPFLTDAEFDDSKLDFNSDPFAGDDPFKDENAFASGNNENFDPFGINASNNNDKADPFGFNAFPENANDPFRTESPTPALPPKNSKAPPPRPAPPKNANKTPLRAAPPPPGANKAANFDPFGSDSFSSSSNFADFS